MNSRQIDNLISSRGDDFSIERNNTIVSTTKGFFCGKEYPDTIQLISTAILKEGDWLIHKPTSQRYYVDKLTPTSSKNSVLSWMAHYITEHKYNTEKAESEKSTYSIGAIYGSAIVGSNNTATINNGYNLSEIKSMISSKPAEDQESLNKLMERIQIITEDNQPVSKGTLAKFSDVLSKHSDIAIALGNSILSWLIGK